MGLKRGSSQLLIRSHLTKSKLWW